MSKKFISSLKQHAKSLSTKSRAPLVQHEQPGEYRQHKLSHLVPSPASYVDVIKKNYMIPGKYLRFFENSRNAIRNAQLERRVEHLERKREVKVSKQNNDSLSIHPKEYKHLQSRILSAIENIQAQGTSSSLNHSLFWKVESIIPNPSLTSAFIRWRTLENSMLSEEAITKTVQLSIPRLQEQIKKELGPKHAVKIKFSRNPEQTSDLEALMDRIQAEHN